MNKIQRFLILILPLAFMFASCSTMIDDFSKMTKKTDEPKAYCLEHHFEEILSDDFVIDPSLTTTGIVNNVNTLSAVTRQDFYFVERVVENNGDDVLVKMYYKRNRVSVTFNPNGGGWGGEVDLAPKVLKGKYGAPVNQDLYAITLKRTDFTFVAWDKSVVVFPEEDCVVTAKWNQEYAKYTVKVKKENIADNGYTETSYTVSGKIGENTAVNAAEIEGFQSPVYSDVPIVADGSTVVTVTYDRLRLNLKFKLCGDEEDKSEFKWHNGTVYDEPYPVNDIKYGASLSDEAKEYISNPTRGEVVAGEEETNWQFAGWNKEYNLPDVITESKVYVAQWAKPASKYKVVTKFEKVGEPGVIDETKTSEVIRIGQAGAVTTVTADKKYPGYAPDEIVQKVISEENEKTVVEIIYRLATVTVQFNLNGGTWQDGSKKDTTEIIEVTGKYGQKVPKLFAQYPKKDLNNFLGWEKSTTKVVAKLDSFTFDETDVIYTAKWEPVGAYAAVRFWTENLDGSYNAGYASGVNFVNDFTQTIIVENGKTTNISPDISDSKYAGFEIASIEQTAIPDNPVFSDEYVIKVKLRRKLIQYTFAPAGGTWLGTWSTHGTAPVVEEKKFGAPVDKPIASPLFRPDYRFTGWDSTIPDNFGPENKMFTAQWEYTGTAYKAQLWFEKLDGSGYEQNDVEYPEKNENGSCMDSLVVTPPTVPGFDYERYDGLETEDKIKADGTTVLKIYYTRKTIKYTFDANGGKFGDGKVYKEISGKYGAAVDMSSVGSPVKEGYDKFNSWSPTVGSTFGPENITFKAQWSTVDVTIITGAGTYTNKDIELDVVLNGNNASIKITVPYNGTWTFEIYDGNNLLSFSSLDKSVNGNIVAYTTTLTTGKHKIEVHAIESGNVKSKFKTVTVQ